MRQTILAIVLLFAPGVALASGPIKTACEESPEGRSVDCNCAQQQADIHLSPEDQVLAADFIANRADPASLIQRRGQQGAMDFMNDFAAWGEASNAACGAPG